LSLFGNDLFFGYFGLFLFQEEGWPATSMERKLFVCNVIRGMKAIREVPAVPIYGSRLQQLTFYSVLKGKLISKMRVERSSRTHDFLVFDSCPNGVFGHG
jgi:hypothetical protein